MRGRKRDSGDGERARGREGSEKKRTSCLEGPEGKVQKRVSARGRRERGRRERGEEGGGREQAGR